MSTLKTEVKVKYNGSHRYSLSEQILAPGRHVRWRSSSAHIGLADAQPILIR